VKGLQKNGSLDMLPLKEQEQGVELKASGEDSVSSDGLDEDDSIESEVLLFPTKKTFLCYTPCSP
jgi:hypothetical protein